MKGILLSPAGDLVLLESVPAAQTLLFPDPRPLVERLGGEFFRQLPEHPGVYLMRDAAEVVLYVGKAKNLRKRLTSYRVANPDRMPRRHLRLLRAVARIELEACADESAALARESELLRVLKPKFNRAGTWPATSRFLIWRRRDAAFELALTEQTESGWQALGPLGSVAPFLRAVVVRLLWRALRPDQSVSQMPAGWIHNQLAATVRLECGASCDETEANLRALFSGQPGRFCDWVTARAAGQYGPFDLAALAEDVDAVQKLIPEGDGSIATGMEE